MDLVDQRGQALWANIFNFILERQVQQRDLLIRAFTVKAYFFCLFVHGFLQFISPVPRKVAGTM